MKAARPFRSHLQGQAGVYQVCAQLALRGINPCVPAVDYGFDIITDTGLRIQVKSANGRKHPGFPVSTYCFSVRENFILRSTKAERKKRRNWLEVCDLFVFWGIDENRFFIVPADSIQENFWIQFKAGTSRSPFLKYEDRWDLLDVNEVSGSIVETAEPPMILTDSGE